MRANLRALQNAARSVFLRRGAKSKETAPTPSERNAADDGPALLLNRLAPQVAGYAPGSLAEIPGVDVARSSRPTAAWRLDVKRRGSDADSTEHTDRDESKRLVASRVQAATSVAEPTGLDFSHDDAVRFVNYLGGLNQLEVLMHEEEEEEEQEASKFQEEQGHEDHAPHLVASDHSVDDSDEASVEDFGHTGLGRAARLLDSFQSKATGLRFWGTEQRLPHDPMRDQEEGRRQGDDDDDGDDDFEDAVDDEEGEGEDASPLKRAGQGKRRKRAKRAKRVQQQEHRDQKKLAVADPTPPGRAIDVSELADRDLASHLKIQAMFKSFEMVHGSVASRQEMFCNFCEQVASMPTLQEEFLEWVESINAWRFMRHVVKLDMRGVRIVRNTVRKIAGRAG